MAPLRPGRVSLFLPPVRLLRRILFGLALLVTLAAVLAGVALLPPVQAWLVERALTRVPGLQASVESASFGFSSVRMTNLRLQRGDRLLTVPALVVDLPVVRAGWDREVVIRKLEARGWTLDLSGTAPAPGQPKSGSPGPLIRSAPTNPPAEPAPPSPAAPAVTRRGLLDRWDLPWPDSLQGVAVEGDILLPPPPGQPSIRLHVKLEGGMPDGRAGGFAVDAAVPLAGWWPRPGTARLQGRLIVGADPPRSIRQLDFEGRLSAPDALLPDDFRVAAGLVAGDETRPETYALKVGAGGHPSAVFAARFDGRAHRLAGTWKLDWRELEMAPLRPLLALPFAAAAGAGVFDTDPGFGRVHVAGRATLSAGGPDGPAPVPGELAGASLASDFDLTCAGAIFQIDRLDVSLATLRPLATGRSRQPFRLDVQTGSVAVADPGADWLTGTLGGVPVAWLSRLGGGLEFSGGDARGELAVRAASGGFAVRSITPLVATGVTVSQAGRKLGQDLDLSLALLAERTAAGWRVQGAPLTIEVGGRRGATIEATVSPPTQPRARIAVTGTWNADLAVLAGQPGFAGAGPLAGRSTSGSFAVSGGRTWEIDSTLQLAGTAPEHTLSTRIRAHLDPRSGIAFQAPITIAAGSGETTIAAEGQWTWESAGPRLELELSGVQAELAHLQLLGAAAGALAGGSWPPGRTGETPATAAAPGLRDQRPFWGDASGRVRFSVFSVRQPEQELTDVAGTLSLDRRALRLEGGRATISRPLRAIAAEPPSLGPQRLSRGPAKSEPARNRLTAEGTVSFDPAADFPYGLAVTAALDAFDAARLFPTDQAQPEPVIEGRFSVTGSVTSRGRNWPDLLERRREEFRLASRGGIVRLLKTSVAASLPEARTPVKDALATVGSAVGALFGVKKEYIDPGVNRLGAATEAVLDFTYQTPEIRYDHLAFTATRDADGPLRLAEIDLRAASHRLTGSGQVGASPGQPLRSRPLRLSLRPAFKGRPAELLATAGLLAAEKDDQGFAPVRQPIEFGGTLERIDNTPWHDLLLQAATPAPARGRKSP